MNKAKLKKQLKELSSVLNSKSAQEAISILEKEIKALKEPEKGNKVCSDSSQFSIPKEIQGKTNAYVLFTDGACRGNPGPGSYGYLIQKTDGEVLTQGAEAFAHTTNNKMEMSGVIKAVQALEDELTPMHELFVYTDSKYIVDGMKSWVAGWKKRGWKKADKKAPENLDLWQELDRLSQVCHIEFNWVKGHAGHPQNEYVDQLANIELDKNGY
jgi:ribonuclease HI